MHKKAGYLARLGNLLSGVINVSNKRFTSFTPQHFEYLHYTVSALKLHE